MHLSSVDDLLEECLREDALAAASGVMVLPLHMPQTHAHGAAVAAATPCACAPSAGCSHDKPPHVSPPAAPSSAWHSSTHSSGVAAPAPASRPLGSGHHPQASHGHRHAPRSPAGPVAALIDGSVGSLTRPAASALDLRAFLMDGVGACGGAAGARPGPACSNPQSPPPPPALPPQSPCGPNAVLEGQQQQQRRRHEAPERVGTRVFSGTQEEKEEEEEEVGEAGAEAEAGQLADRTSAHTTLSAGSSSCAAAPYGGPALAPSSANTTGVAAAFCSPQPSRASSRSDRTYADLRLVSGGHGFSGAGGSGSVGIGGGGGGAHCAGPTLGRPLPVTVLTRLRKAASDVVTQLKSLGSGRSSRASSRADSIGTATPDTAAAAVTPTALSLRPSIECGGGGGAFGWAFGPEPPHAGGGGGGAGVFGGASGRRLLRSPLHVSSTQVDAAAPPLLPAVSAAYVTAPAALDAASLPPSPLASCLGRNHSASFGSVGPGAGVGAQPPVGGGAVGGGRGSGAFAGVGTGRGSGGSCGFLDDRGGVDLLPDMWDLAQVWEELDDTLMPAGAAPGAAGGRDRRSRSVCHTAPVALFDAGADSEPESEPAQHRGGSRWRWLSPSPLPQAQAQAQPHGAPGGGRFATTTGVQGGLLHCGGGSAGGGGGSGGGSTGTVGAAALAWAATFGASAPTGGAAEDSSALAPGCGGRGGGDGWQTKSMPDGYDKRLGQYDDEQEYILSKLVQAARRSEKAAQRSRLASPKPLVIVGAAATHGSLGVSLEQLPPEQPPLKDPQSQVVARRSIASAQAPFCGWAAAAEGLCVNETHAGSAPPRLVAHASAAGAAAPASACGSVLLGSSLCSPLDSALPSSLGFAYSSCSVPGTGVAASASATRRTGDDAGAQDLAASGGRGRGGGGAAAAASACAAIPIPAVSSSLTICRFGSSALNSGASGAGLVDPGPELSMMWPLVMPTPLPAAASAGDAAGPCTASYPFTLNVLVGCGCGGTAGCVAAVGAADGGGAAAAAAPPSAVTAMLSGVEIAHVPLQPGGGCQAAALRLPLLPSMQLLSVFSTSGAAVGPAANLLAVPPAIAAELHSLFAERVTNSLERLTALTSDAAAGGVGAADAAATSALQARVAADLAALRSPSAERPPWDMCVPVSAACRAEWRSWVQPLLADVCYLLLCVPNCFAHGLVEWDRSMYCETLARLLGQLEGHKLWRTLAALLEYCSRAGVELRFRGSAVDAASLTPDRLRALLEGALHDEISIKAVGPVCAGGGGGGGGGDAAVAAAARGSGSVGSVGSSAGGGRARRRATLASLLSPDAADAATARTLTAWRRRSVDGPGRRPQEGWAQQPAEPASPSPAPSPAAAAGRAGPPAGGGPPLRSMRTQASISRALGRVVARLAGGDDRPADGGAESPSAAAAAVNGEAGAAVAGAAAAAAAAPVPQAQAAQEGPRLGHVVENAAVVLAFAGVVMQTLL